MAQNLEPMPMQIHYGHNDTHILVQFSASTNMLIMTVEQADAMVKEITAAKKLFLDHLAKKPKNG